MKTNLSSKAVLAFSLIFSVWHLVVAEGFAQETKTEADGFINLGNIAFSPDYILANDLIFITFKIRNNSARPITNIFAWVYKFKGEKDGQTSGFVLANNPHKGGLLVKGGAHAPGEIAEWRFSLAGVKKTNAPEWKYTLRVSPKSIFFGDNTLKRDRRPEKIKE